MSNEPPPYQSVPGGFPGQPGFLQTAAALPVEPRKKRKGRLGRGAADPDAPAKAPTRKVATRQLKLAALFAVLAAGAGAYVVNSSGNTGKWVVVAASPIATNTVVSAPLLKAIQLPESAIAPGAVTAADAKTAVGDAVKQLATVRTQYPFAPNQQIVPAQFGVQINLGQPLGPDERLMSIRASVAASLAGSITAGDNVDIYAAAADVSGPVALNVPIVSVTVSEDRYNAVADQQASNKNAKPSDLLPGDPVPGTYVIRVKADMVAKIVAVDSGAKLYLVYRGDKATDPNSTPVTAKDAICATGGAGLAACAAN